MLGNRLLGQETEYALRFTPDPGARHPGNFEIFQAMSHAIGRLVAIKPGDRHFLQEQYFTENGGAFCYEHLPYAPDGGLLEGATPECRTPSELILYQKAQELLFVRALAGAESNLSRSGFPGTLGLIKNCRDSEGHIYGAQENYEARIAAGWRLLLYRACLLSFFPLLMATLAVYWLLTLSLILLFLLLAGLAIVLFGLVYFTAILMKNLIRMNLLKRAVAGLTKFREKVVAGYDHLISGVRLEEMVNRIEFHIFFPLQVMVFLPFNLMLRCLAFRPQRKALLGFMISRPILSGAGTLLDDETFALSEKAVAIRHLVRVTIGPNDRALFDSGNIIKGCLLGAMDLWLCRPAGFKHLFQTRQRLQLGLSDSNRAQLAEYLKVGTTLLVLEAAEAGFLRDAPAIRHPKAALKTINEDSSLQSKVAVKRGQPLSAIEIQRVYAAGVRAFLQQAPSVPMEYFEILRIWEETLTHLETDPGQLIGRLDWVTKRYLLETSGAHASPAARKKIDIGYHELEWGYFDALEREDVAPCLVSREEADRAMKEPSSPAGVRLRSRMIRDPVYPGRRMAVSWHTVRIGSGLQRKVVPLFPKKPSELGKDEI